MPATTGDTVRVHYRGVLDDGTQFDTSSGRDPLTFTVGEGSVIAGFDEGVTGLEPGESRTVRMEADRAYGARVEELIHRVSADLFDEEPYAGAEIELMTPDGDMLPGRIALVENGECVVDFNHPLAGEALTFEIELVEILPRAEA